MCIEMLAALIKEFYIDLNLIDEQVIFLKQDALAHNFQQVKNLLEDSFVYGHLSTNGCIVHQTLPL